MGDGTPAAIELSGIDLRQLVRPVTILAEHELVMVRSLNAYMATSGNPSHDAICVICGNDIELIPFILVTMARLDPCGADGNHFPAVTVPIHVACDNGGNQPIIDAVMALAANCEN
jgi:hypothetical protein